MKTPETVEEYIAAQPAEVVERLRQIRKVVKGIAPGAIEKLSYGMPYYALQQAKT